MEVRVKNMKKRKVNLNREKRKEEFRAELKELEEQRADLAEQMETILNKAKEEKRALSEEEQSSFDALEKQINDIDKTLEIEQRAAQIKDPKKNKGDAKDVEVRAFENYIRGVVEQRAALTMGDNGAVIPSSIANKIIEKVIDLCPIYQLATRYNVGGTLSIPYYNEETQSIEMAYSTEFTDLESTSGKFASIELKGFLAGSLTKISKSLVKNSKFDIVNFVINAMSKTIAKWIEKELLNGTEDKITGLSSAKQKITAASATAITSDELIDLQEEVPDAYQGSAIWIMNKKTRTAIRKLKDNDGNYLLNRDVSAKWGYTLLGKDVYTSANMPTMAAGKTAIYYGDMSGLAVKVSEDANIEVLREKFATQHAIGVVAWLEMDAKIEDEQKIAKLEMKTA